MTTPIRATILTSILALPGALPAEEVVISVAVEQLAPEAAGTITLVSVDGDDGVIRELGAPGATSVRAAVEGLEYVSCRGRLVWCPQVRIDASESSAVDGEAPPVRVVSLTAHALADLALPLVLPSDESLRGTPVVEGWLEAAAGTLHFLEPAVVDGDVLRWRGPAGRTDYRIAAEGWAPGYLFEQDVGAGVTRLEPLRLVRGASVSLHAVERDSGLPVAGAAVRAEPYPPPAADGSAAAASRAVTAEDGFAQLVGLDGEYVSLIVESQSPAANPDRWRPAGTGRRNAACGGRPERVCRGAGLHLAAERCIGRVASRPAEPRSTCRECGVSDDRGDARRCRDAPSAHGLVPAGPADS